MTITIGEEADKADHFSKIRQNVLYLISLVGILSAAEIFFSAGALQATLSVIVYLWIADQLQQETGYDCKRSDKKTGFGP